MKDANINAEMDRRNFLAMTLGTAGFQILNSSLVRGSRANSALRLGLLGCDDRGRANAHQMIKTGLARLVAIADLFPYQLMKTKEYFDTINASNRQSLIARSQMFAGPSAFQKICASKEVDAMLICSPSYFRPQHFIAAVEAGKHVYCEAPIAIDVAGAKEVHKIGKKAEGRVTLDVGLRLRKTLSFIELMDRIHNGAIGTIGCGDIFCSDRLCLLKGWPSNGARDADLSKNTFVEQNIHMIDLFNWALRSRPLKAFGQTVSTGYNSARSRRNVVFYYPGGVHVGVTFAGHNKAQNLSGVRFFGTKGTCESRPNGQCVIYGEEAWASEGIDRALLDRDNRPKLDPAECGETFDFAMTDKKRFIESIFGGTFYNSVHLGVESALAAILGRTAASRAHEVAWDDLASSGDKWSQKLT